MEIISKAQNLDKKLSLLIKKYKDISIATAWASMGSKSADQLLDNKVKIRQMVVGIHFYQTHPNFIKEFMNGGKPRVKFILNSNGVYHPKVYLFSNGDQKWECLIGSANFTQSALTRNTEVMVHITSDDNESNNIYDSLVELIDGYWKEAEVMTEKLYDKYRNIWELKHKKVNKLAGKYGESKTPQSLVKSDLFSYTWNEYYKRIQEEKLEDGFERRIKLLNTTRKYFKKYKHLASMNKEQRQQIAGTIEPRYDWGWFGFMKANGVFKQQINNNNKWLSKGLDKIPLYGSVSKEHYMAFVKEFLHAFPNGRDGIATATRLLTMKRPDIFLCYNKANRALLESGFGIPMPRIEGPNKNYEVYWDEIIERIHDCVWWQSDEPIDEIEAQAWRGRAAMLDAITYRYDQ
jgi:HKD family nuclease